MSRGPVRALEWIGIGRLWTGAQTGAPIEHETRSIPRIERGCCARPMQTCTRPAVGSDDRG